MLRKIIIGLVLVGSIWWLDYTLNSLPLTAPKGVDLTGKLYVVTGCSFDGIGFEIAKALKQYNAKVVCAMRNKEKAEAVKKYMDKEVKNGEFAYEFVDLSSLKSASNFADKLRTYPQTIDGLVLNAGAASEPLKVTEDEFDDIFQVNHLSQFLILKKLLPKLTEKTARVVTLSSGASTIGRIDRAAFSRKPPVRRLETSVDIYSDAKLMNIYVANELFRRHKITAHSVDPGLVHTAFQQKMGDAFERIIFEPLAKIVGRTPAEGASRALIVLLTKEFANNNHFITAYGRLPFSFKNEQDEKFLWDESEKFVKKFLQ